MKLFLPQRVDKAQRTNWKSSFLPAHLFRKCWPLERETIQKKLVASILTAAPSLRRMSRPLAPKSGSIPPTFSVFNPVTPDDE
jgi:hypothetical protein